MEFFRLHYPGIMILDWMIPVISAAFSGDVCAC